MADAERRRRRSRSGADHDGTDPADQGAGSAATAELHDPEPETTGHRRRSGPPGEDRDGERGLRGLVGSGSSQVTVRAALRARDAARPTAADLAEAEAELTVVRRNWVPREELPRNGR